MGGVKCKQSSMFTEAGGPSASPNLDSGLDSGSLS